MISSLHSTRESRPPQPNIQPLNRTTSYTICQTWYSKLYHNKLWCLVFCGKQDEDEGRGRFDSMENSIEKSDDFTTLFTTLSNRTMDDRTKDERADTVGTGVRRPVRGRGTLGTYFTTWKTLRSLPHGKIRMTELFTRTGKSFLFIKKKKIYFVFLPFSPRLFVSQTTLKNVTIKEKKRETPSNPLE